MGRGVFDKTYRTAFQRPRNHVVLHRARRGQVGNFGRTPGSAARAKKNFVRRASSPFTACFGSASSGSGWCPVPALPSSRKPSGCQRSPPRRTPAAKQVPSASLLPIYSTGAAFQGAPGDSDQIKSLFALQASYLYSPRSEETLQKPDSEVNGMTKRGHCLLQFKLRSGAP